MGGVEFDIFEYLVYLLCDRFVFNSAVIVYDQDVVYVSGIVSYVFYVEYVFYINVFVVLNEYFGYCVNIP